MGLMLPKQEIFDVRSCMNIKPDHLDITERYNILHLNYTVYAGIVSDDVSEKDPHPIPNPVVDLSKQINCLPIMNDFLPSCVTGYTHGGACLDRQKGEKIAVSSWYDAVTLGCIFKQTMQRCFCSAHARSLHQSDFRKTISPFISFGEED